jgi:endonuclease/exonuclease/phosphatase family metal-dependent hydrolase
VVGDFNDWRDTLANAALAAGGFSQVTHPPSRYRSFPAWLAVGALDKAFVRGAIEVRQARIVKTSLTRAASDHLPLVMDFHLA